MTKKESMIKKIGGVSINYQHYPGEDLYSDGVIEDELLAIAKNYDESQFAQIIEEKLSWPILYHFSEQRKNIVSWYPLTKSDRVLEVGAGCGAITGALADKAGQVTCVDLSEKRSLVNAYRNKNRANIEILLGNFLDVEKDLPPNFDYITLIGVFEYGQAYIGGKQPYLDFLRILLRHVKPGGKVLIAIENKNGLKYFAGCQEDHVGKFFEGMEGYQNTNGVRTFSHPEWIRMMKECELSDYFFYYPHPDYKFPRLIYSDAYLPKAGELNQNICNFDRNRMVLFDEGKVYNQLIDDGMYPYFANSFLIEIRKEEEHGQ
jgi:2-polyprenyl-3-methyl-5-hydroxy-6-metoxy-1,4-benzoquinol methylase